MDLKNTWLYKFYCLVIYPKSILSKSTFIGDIDITSLIENQQVFVMRRSSFPHSKTFIKISNEVYHLRADIIKKSDLLNLSTNLAGCKFKEKHLKFRLLIGKFGANKWNKYDTISFFKNPVAFLSSISIFNEGCSIYIDANKTHNLTHPYERQKDKEIEKFIKAFSNTSELEKDLNGKETYKVNAFCRFKHDPLNFNYWHFEYVISDFKQSEIEKYGPKWLDNLCKSIVSDVFTFYSYHKPNARKFDIPEKYYIKSA